MDLETVKSIIQKATGLIDTLSSEISKTQVVKKRLEKKEEDHAVQSDKLKADIESIGKRVSDLNARETSLVTREAKCRKSDELDKAIQELDQQKCSFEDHKTAELKRIADIDAVSKSLRDELKRMKDEYQKKFKELEVLKEKYTKAMDALKIE